jgi:hypothetical protein
MNTKDTLKRESGRYCKKKRVARFPGGDGRIANFIGAEGRARVLGSADLMLPDVPASTDRRLIETPV